VYRLDIYLVSGASPIKACASYNHSPGESDCLPPSGLIASTPGFLRLIHSPLRTYVSGICLVRAALLIYEHAVNVWSYNILRDCLERMSSEGFARIHVNYSKVSEIERALRSYPKPVILQHGTPIPPEFSADSVYLSRCRVLWAMREEASQYRQPFLYGRVADDNAFSSGVAAPPTPFESSIVRRFRELRWPV
jgi:hypothetical protein